MLFVTLMLLGSGCITAKKNTPPKEKVYVEPCHVAATDVQIRVKASKLSADVMSDELIGIFVDDLDSPTGQIMRQTHKYECYWGQNIGEVKDYYYCAGEYRAPELDPTQVITRLVWKDYKVGFSVEEENLGAWVDAKGVSHDAGNVYYLTVKTVDAKCYIS